MSDMDDLKAARKEAVTQAEKRLSTASSTKEKHDARKALKIAKRFASE